MLTRKTVVLAKLESTYGTDPTPDGTNDAILVSNPDLKVDGAMLTRDYVRASLSPISHAIGKKKVTISFETDLKGSGAAGTAPETSPLWQSCGMDETIVASTSVTYDPEAVSTEVKSCTMYVYFDGLMHEINGCRGSFSITMEAGNFGKVSWNFEGKYVKPTDTALVTGTFDSTIPQIIQSSSFTVNSYAATINALAFDIANTIGSPGDVNSADGYGNMHITGRDSNGSLDPEAVLVATEDFWGDWADATGVAVTITIGATAGNICDIDMPNIVYREIGYGDREGIRTYQIPFTAAETASTNDEISIVYT
jgi:hypothetical protein